jgi:SpoVK/Ycf46/Vps4 family AAA+-type ATPase
MFSTITEVTKTRVIDIYGSSETGHIAWRSSPAEPWRVQAGVEFKKPIDNVLEIKSKFCPSDAWFPTSDLARQNGDSFEILGRVDQIIHIGYPTLEERIELFKMYLGKLMNESINLDLIAKLSYGLTGSDIKKIVNSIKINKVYEKTLTLKSKEDVEESVKEDAEEDAEEDSDIIIESKKELFEILTKHLIQRITNLNKFIKSKQNKKLNEKEFEVEIKPTTQDIDKEINKCILGLERERKINLTNKKLISFHETGHAIMSFMLKDAKLPTKICISITSKTLGYTMYTQDDEDLIMGSSINNLIAQVMILYAGRSAEKLFMNEITGGAEDDYMKARKILKRLVMNGMLYPEFNFVESNGQESQKVPEHIEKLLSKINKYLIQEVDQILTDNSDIVKLTAEKIQESGSINGQDIFNIFESTGKTHLIQSIGTNQFYNHISTY